MSCLSCIFFYCTSHLNCQLTSKYIPIPPPLTPQVRWPILSCPVLLSVLTIFWVFHLAPLHFLSTEHFEMHATRSRLINFLIDSHFTKWGHQSSQWPSTSSPSHLLPLRLHLCSDTCYRLDPKIALSILVMHFCIKVPSTGWLLNIRWSKYLNLDDIQGWEHGLIHVGTFLQVAGSQLLLVVLYMPGEHADVSCRRSPTWSVRALPSWLNSPPKTTHPNNRGG